MMLRNHIAYRFLCDEDFPMEMLEGTYPEEYAKYGKDKKIEDINMEKLTSYYDLLVNKQAKNYYITDSVLRNLELLKLEKEENGHYNWGVFRNLAIKSKWTFVFPDNTLLRMKVYENSIAFCFLQFEFHDKKKGIGRSKWENFFVDRLTGDLCDHFGTNAMNKIEDFIYSFLCFMFLTENDEVVLHPNQSHGTRRTGKIVNELKIPLTIVNSRWNITTIRNEGFAVSGHFRLQPCGAGRIDRKLIFIEPFEKKGYVRTAKSITDGIQS